MIISASRRTDIPALYGEWFMNRVREGFVYVRNPYNFHNVSKIPLTADLVDIIVFWTKDPLKFMGNLKELDERGYKYYFQFTLNPYDNDVEIGLRDKSEIINTFAKLSSLIGKSRILWRYDPIIISQNIDVNYHLDNFERLADKLSNYTDSVTISFLDDYKKTERRMTGFRKPSLAEMESLGNGFAKVAKDRGMAIRTCAEEIVFKNGIEKTSCIDARLIKQILGENIQVSKDKNQRKECLCVESIDIGEYDTCPHFCQYCYANCGEQRIQEKFSRHNPDSPLLIGNVLPEDSIKERKTKSIKTGQTVFLT